MTMTAATVAIVVTVAAGFVYPLIMRMCAKLAYQKRMEMADLGTELLNRPDLPDEHREMVWSILREAFDWKVMPKLLLSTLKALVTFGKTRPLLGGSEFDKQFSKLLGDDLSHDVREKIKSFIYLSQVSFSAANPFFAILTYFSAILMVFVLMAKEALFRKRVSVDVVQPSFDASKRLFERVRRLIAQESWETLRHS